MPNGLTFQKHAPSKPRVHPFVITREDGSRVHACALTFYEPVDERAEHICEAMQTLQTMWDAEYNVPRQSSSSSTTASSYPKSQRSISVQYDNSNDSPLLPLTSTSATSHMYSASSSSSSSSSSFKHHAYNIDKDRLYVSKCICVLGSLPLATTYETVLRTLHAMAGEHDLLGMSLESHLACLLGQVPLPVHGQLLRFSVGCTQLRVYMPDLYHETLVSVSGGEDDSSKHKI